MTQSERISQIDANVATLLERTDGLQQLRAQVTAIATTQAACIARQAEEGPHTDREEQNRIGFAALIISGLALVCVIWATWETRQAAKRMTPQPERSTCIDVPETKPIG